jgi:cytochrome c5
MDKTEDARFLRKFSSIIVFFIVLTGALIILAFSMTEQSDEVRPSQAMLIEERISPVSAVRVGEEGAAALAQAEAEEIAAAPAMAEAAGDIDGAAVYGGLCMSCHDAGVAGAPMKGSDMMAQRLEEKGLEMLVSNAINGIGIMPARGGNPALTDDEIRAAVEYMLP